MDDKPTETAPPKTDPETGVALEGEYPHNHRLRAEALAKAGKDKDPDGIVSPELIVDAGERLERQAAAEEAAKAEAERASTELHKMTTKQLEETALLETVDLSSAKTNADRVKLIEDARAAKSAPPPGAPGTVDNSEPGSTGAQGEGAE